jgi:GR25 family glycosyltransferase involved in LPS biosynthesis
MKFNLMIPNPIAGCFVINLPHRTDRWKLFQEQLPLLQTLGITPERMDAVYGRKLPGFGEKPWFTKRLSEKRANAWGGKAGCTLSHRNAIALAKERGWKNVLIVEDDVSFDATIAGQWANLVDTMAKLPDDWIAIYLYGHHPIPPVRVVYTYPETTCYELCGAYSTTAYILNSKYFDDLLHLMPRDKDVWAWTARHKTVDRWFSCQLCLLGRVYAWSPFGIVHLETPSDATTSGEAYEAPSFRFKSMKRDSFFGVKRILKCMQNQSSLRLSLIRFGIKRLCGL